MVGFRAHHAVMDGRGLFTWIEDVFRALRGETPLGSASKLSDFQAARTFQKGWRSIMPHEFCAPTGMPRGREPGNVWRRPSWNWLRSPIGWPLRCSSKR